MTTATLTLADFLLARIAEDDAETNYFLPKTTGTNTSRHLRQRLAECEAKRRIVEEHRQAEVDDVWPEDFGPACLTCGTYWEYPDKWPCPTLRALALPYADHDQFREEWRP